MGKEIWKDIENYEGYYQASNFGKIKSLNRYVFSNISNIGIRLIKSKILGHTYLLFLITFISVFYKTRCKTPLNNNKQGVQLTKQ